MIGQLAVNFPDTWGQLPKGLFNYGGGGVNGYGAICGNPNGASAILKMIGAPTAMMNEFLAWFEKTYLPTNAAYLDYRGGTWVPGGSATGGWGSAANQLLIPFNNAPKVKPESVLCHVAHTRWKDASASWLAAKGAAGNSDRCSKTTYDSVYKLVTMINDWKAGATFAGTLDPSVAACKAAGCHAAIPTTGTSGNMKCTPCHTERVGDGHNL